MLSCRSLLCTPSLSFTRMCFLVKCLKRLKSSQQWLSRQRADPYVEKAKIYNYRQVLCLEIEKYLISPLFKLRRSKCSKTEA